MKVSTRILAAVIAGALGLASAGGRAPVRAQDTPAGAGRSLTLEAALEIAFEQNPNIRAAREQLNFADGAVLGAMGRMLPTLSFSGLWNFAEKVQEIRNPFPAPGMPSTLKIDFTLDYQGGIDLSLPVFSWGAVQAGYQDARTGRDQALNSLETTQRDVQMQVTQAFYGILLAEQGLQVARDALAQAERQEEIAARRLEHGAASEFDHLRARVQVANLKPAVARAEAMFDQARIGLNLLLGLEPDEPITLRGELRYTPFAMDLEQMKLLAHANRTELHNARLSLQRSDLGIRMARASRLPALMMTGSWSFRAQNLMLSEQYNDSYATYMVVAVPVFDAFQAKSRVRMAEAGQQQAQIMVNSMTRAVEAECESAYHDLKAAEEGYLAQADNVRVAERALQIAEVSFENEIMTSVELMDSQLALTMARQNYYQSLYDYLVALARIEKAIGQSIDF